MDYSLRADTAMYLQYIATEMRLSGGGVHWTFREFGVEQKLKARSLGSGNAGTGRESEIITWKRGEQVTRVTWVLFDLG